MIRTRANISDYAGKDLERCRTEFTCAVGCLKCYMAKVHEIAEDGDWYETEHNWLYFNLDMVKESLSRATAWRLGKPSEYPIGRDLDGENGTYCKLIDSIDDITSEEQDRIREESGGNGAGMIGVHASSAANAVKLMSHLYYDIAHSKDFRVDERHDFIRKVARNFATMGIDSNYLEGVKKDVIDQPALYQTWKQYTSEMLDEVKGLHESIQRDLQEIPSGKVKKKSRQKALAHGM